MSVYMRAVLRGWHSPAFHGLEMFVGQKSPFRVRPISASGWDEFEVHNHDGVTVLAADLTKGSAAREELEELAEFVDELEGGQSRALS